MPRIFVSLPIPASVRQNLARLPMDSISEWRWVKPDLYHITLAFIGEISETDVLTVKAAVSQTVIEMKIAPCALAAQGLGAFPNKQRARVVWAGLTGHTAPLIGWQAALADNLTRAAFATDRRPFTPHITLGRARQPAPIPRQWQPFTGESFGSWTAEHVHIVESQLSPAGPRYTVRHKIALTPASDA